MNICRIVQRFIKLIFDLIIILLFLLSTPFTLIIHLFQLRTSTFKNNLFIGIHEIAGNITSISNSLSNSKYCVHVYIEQSFYQHNYTFDDKLNVREVHGSNLRLIAYYWRRLQLFLNFYYYQNRCNIFYFVWNTTFLPFNLDLIYLSKILNKEVIMMHCGDDARYRPLHKFIDQSFSLKSKWQDKSRIPDFIFKLYFTLLTNRYTKVVSSRTFATFQTKKNYFFMFPQKRTRDIPKNINKTPLIVHAPTDRHVKGTCYVEGAIKILSEKGYKFDFSLIENQANDFVLMNLKKADIVIDQIGVWYGRLAVEAMAEGCCVISGNCKEYIGFLDSPVIQFEPNETKLSETLIYLLRNKDILQRKMIECFAYFSTYYDEQLFINHFQKLINGDAQSFNPLPNQKEILLKGCSNWVEKFAISKFYHPSCK